MVLVAEHAGDLAELGIAAVQQHHDLTLALVEQGHEVSDDQVALDLGLRSLDGDGVGELDEPDLHLVALVVELPLEVLAGVGPPVGEVVLDPVRADRFDDCPELAGGIGGVDHVADDLRGPVLATPEGPAASRERGDRALEEAAVDQRHALVGDGLLAGDDREAAEDVVQDRVRRRDPEVEVVGQQPDRVRAAERALGRPRAQVPPDSRCPRPFKPQAEVRGQEAVRVDVVGHEWPDAGLQQRKALTLSLRAGQQVEQRGVLVVPGRRPRDEADIEVALVGDLHDLRRQLVVTEESAAKLSRLPEQVPLRDRDPHLVAHEVPRHGQGDVLRRIWLERTDDSPHEVARGDIFDRRVTLRRHSLRVGEERVIPLISLALARAAGIAGWDEFLGHHCHTYLTTD